jgi:exosortase/archaeosortase family protein
VSLLSLTAVAAAFLSMSARRGLMLMAAAVPIAIVGNGLRVAATGLLSTAMGEAAARGLVHDLTGYAAFIAMCAVIVALLVASKPRPLLAQA